MSRGVLPIIGLLTLALAVSSINPVAASSAGDPVVKQWPSWPYPVTCDLDPPSISFRPVSVFGGAAEAESGALPAKVRLREFLAAPENALPLTGWRFLGQNLARAEFVHGALPSNFILLSAYRVDGPWSFSPELGACTPTSIVGTRPATPWHLARGDSLTPASRRVRVRLQVSECSGWRSINAHTHVAFRQVNRGALLMTAWTDPLPRGNHACLKSREGPFTASLPGPLGKRKLFDGGTYPPIAASAAD